VRVKALLDVLSAASRLALNLNCLLAQLCGCDDRTESGLALAPSLQLLQFFGDTLYLSLEARYQVIVIDGADPQALVLGAGLGAGF
jgi:hypothetical protein